MSRSDDADGRFEALMGQTWSAHTPVWQYIIYK